MRPAKISIKKKYHYLGMATDFQRGAIYVIIEKSSKGQWTRYADMEVESPESRMFELMNDKRFDIKHRRVAGFASNGTKTYFSEFAV